MLKLDSNVHRMEASGSSRSVQLQPMPMTVAFAIDRVPKGGVLHVRLTDKHQAFETLTENLDADPIHKFLLKGQFHLLVRGLFFWWLLLLLPLFPSSLLPLLLV